MFFNHPAEWPEPRFPPSVYARVDQIEEISEGEEVVIFDCIDVNWVEEFGGDGLALCDLKGELGQRADRALSIVVAEARPIRNKTGPVAEDQWYRIDFDDLADTDWFVEQYTAFFSDPNQRKAIIEPICGALEDQLRNLAGWGQAMPSSMSDIKGALAQVTSPDAVAIYDVGQGAATALLTNGHPLLYFDFGGAAIGNWRSFPLHLTQFCFTAKPPIVLSHWDWDHWSSSLRDPEAFDVTWILPLQAQSGSLGSVHSRFLAKLYAQGTTLLWWDPKYRALSLPNANARIVKADGPPSSRNESGLALVVDKTTQESQSVLLPGDASFAQLATNVGTTFDHMMVPHHGGKSDISILPQATTKSCSHQIYSYGVGNIFLHPRNDVVKAYRTVWKKNTHTALRSSSGFGHVWIDLIGNRATPASPPCNGKCRLSAQYWLTRKKR